jgi:hypothetical protein
VIYGFCDGFLRLHKILLYLIKATAISRFVVEGEEKMLCAKLLILCGVTKAVKTYTGCLKIIVFRVRGLVGDILLAK